MPRPRPVHMVLGATLLAALAVGATGALLTSRFRAAAVAALVDRQAIAVESRAHLLDEELSRLVAEVTRLSRLAEVDLEDRNPEPEKQVLRIARRDTALFSISIAILDFQGELVWSEPHGVRPAGGAALVGRARGLGHAVVSLSPGEIAVAAPVTGHGAIVGLVRGQERDLFGQTLQGAARGRGGLALEEVDGPRVAAAGQPIAPELVAGVDRRTWEQRWIADRQGRRWLVTEARLSTAPLVLRLAQPAEELLAGLSGPTGNLLAIVVGALVFVLAGGGLLAFALGRLDRADAELRRSRELAAVGRTATAIAHEVKNSLNGLSVAVDLLASGRAGAEAVQAVHRQARQEVDRLRGVAEDLTLFAAPPRLALAPVDLSDLCRQAVAGCAGLGEDMGARLELHLPDGPLLVQGDPGKLLSALLNLVRNALEAVGPGGSGEPLGAPARRERRVLVSARRQGGEALAEVADTGPGISAEVRAQLFEPFVSTKRTGTGLGLAIARRVAVAHGGRIEAGERPGGGALFRLWVPLLAAAAEERPAAPARPGEVAGG